MTTIFRRLYDMNPLLPFIAPSVPDYWEIVLERAKVIYRHEWGAETPRRRDFLDLPVYNVVFVFDPGVGPCDTHKSCVRRLKELQAQEFKKVGRPDIKQNFLVAGNGTVYEGRGWKIQGMCPDKYFNLDNKSLSIGFMGDYRNKFEDENEIITREEWGAKPPVLKMRMKGAARHLLLVYRSSHFTCYRKVDCLKSLKKIQESNMSEELDDIQYNFLIGGNGLVYEGRGWNTICPAPRKYNSIGMSCFSIAFIGDYSQREPSYPMILSARKLIEIAIKKGDLRFHHDLVTFRGEF